MLKKVNVSQLISQLWTSQFQLSSPGFKYLGVAITWPIRSLRKQNSVALASKFTLNLQRWSCLPLSLAGRVQIVKMNVLPRYLYLFQCLPIFLPRLFFKSIDSDVSQFIWASKNPRICKADLQPSRLSGGLGLPNLSYYWAANVHKRILWFTSPAAAGVWFMHIFITASFGTYYPALTHSTHLTIVASLKNWAQGDILSGLPFLKHPSLCTCQNWSTIHVPGQKGSVLIERFLCGRVICNFRPATSHVWFLDMFNYRNSKELK